jgi:hypothetical protein
MSILLALGWTGLDNKKTILKALIEAAILNTVYGVKLVTSSRKKSEKDNYRIQHQHAFDVNTVQPVIKQPMTKNKKEVPPEILTSEDIAIVNQFIQLL